MKNNANHSIGCVVNECRYHAENENYCTLEHIQVSKHEAHANAKECTDCSSFEEAKRTGCCR